MTDRPIENCAWRFEFKCPRTWDALRETPEAGVRACDSCQKPVYLCRSESELSHHVQQGHCVAVPARVRLPTPAPELSEPKDLEPVEVLAARYGVPVIHLDGLKLDPHVLRQVPLEVGRGHHLFPVASRGSTLVVAMSDPSRVEAIDKVRFLTGHDVEVRVAPWREILRALARWPHYLQEETEALDVGLVVPLEHSSPGLVEKLLHVMLTEARGVGAEQIRIEANDSRLVIRYLVAGALREARRLPRGIREPLLRFLQARSGTRTEQPGLFEDRSHRYQVFFRHLEQDVEVVLTPLGAERG